MSIRPANIEDLGKLKQLFRDSILKTGQAHYTEEQLIAWSNRADSVKRWNELIESQYTLVLEWQNNIVGFASLRGSDYFDFLYVAPKQQGKGYAKELFKAIIAKAIERGANEVYSDVSYMAKPFFLAQGFAQQHANENKIGSEVLVNFRVKKVL